MAHTASRQIFSREFSGAFGGWKAKLAICLCLIQGKGYKSKKKVKISP
jgi:hypothetical protein